jgi:hypothetical protein
MKCRCICILHLLQLAAFNQKNDKVSARGEEIKMSAKFWLENFTSKDMEDPEVDGRIIVKRILEKQITRM